MKSLDLDVVGRKLKYHADEYYIIGLYINGLEDITTNRYFYRYMRENKEEYLLRLLGFLVKDFVLYGIKGADKNNVILLPTHYYLGVKNRQMHILSDKLDEEERNFLALKATLTNGYEVDTIDSIKDKLLLLYSGTGKGYERLYRLLYSR